MILGDASRLGDAITRRLQVPRAFIAFDPSLMSRRLPLDRGGSPLKKNRLFSVRRLWAPPTHVNFEPSGPGGRGGPRGSPQRRWRPLHGAYAWYVDLPPPFPRELLSACMNWLEIDFCVCAVKFWIFLPRGLASCRADAEKIDIERPITGGFSIAGRRGLRRASRAERFAP